MQSNAIGASSLSDASDQAPTAHKKDRPCSFPNCRYRITMYNKRGQCFFHAQRPTWQTTADNQAKRHLYPKKSV